MIQAAEIDKISPLLAQLLDSLKEFQTLLNTEAGLLKLQDTVPLTELLIQKEQLSGKITETFNALMSNFSPSLPLNEFILSDTFKQLPLSIQKNFSDVTTLAIDCQHQNTTNGITVQALANFNQTLLHIFKGQDPSEKTYSASGQTSVSDKKNPPIGKA